MDNNEHSTNLAEVGTDYISRQAAIDFIDAGHLVNPNEPRWSDNEVVNFLKSRPSAQPEQRWIPCSERLPENAKHKGAFCPKYYVMTEFGHTEGWYNPDVGCWYVLLWFMDARFENWNISLERGDVPKLVKNVPVVAWMPLPEPYKERREDG